ncbi:MAG: tellurite resistance/C4-dicarboxylate transporter family protein [Metallosphaera sp.]
MLRKILYEISVLSPSYFGMVMATGVLSILFKVFEQEILSYVFTWLNLLIYSVLVCFTLLRLLKYSDKLKVDLLDFNRGLGFLTFVAGTDVIGDDMILILDKPLVALLLWGTSLVFWISFQYLFLFILMIRQDKPGFRDVNGQWLLIPVSTLTLSVLSTDLSSRFQGLVYAGLITYLIGWVVYLIVIVFIAIRLFLTHVRPEDVIPAYWINGGFPALAALSSSLLFLHSSSFPYLKDFLLGTGLLIWAYGTWWMPLLFLSFFWKHIIRKISLLRYDFQFWSAVFPIAVYDLGTYFLGKVSEIPGISLIATVFCYVTIAVWVYQFLGFVRNVTLKIR